MALDERLISFRDFLECQIATLVIDKYSLDKDKVDKDKVEDDPYATYALIRYNETRDKLYELFPELRLIKDIDTPELVKP